VLFVGGAESIPHAGIPVVYVVVKGLFLLLLRRKERYALSVEALVNPTPIGMSPALSVKARAL